MDYVGIKLYTPDGRLEGELRLVACSPRVPIPARCGRSPISASRWAQVLQRAGFDPDSHSGKAALHILENIRVTIVQVDAETLYNFLMEILTLYERPACGRWHGPINSTVSSPSSSSFRVINMTPMCVRVSRSFWRRSIRGAWQRPTPPFPKGRLPAFDTSWRS